MKGENDLLEWRKGEGDKNRVLTGRDFDSDYHPNLKAIKFDMIYNLPLLNEVIGVYK